MLQNKRFERMNSKFRSVVNADCNEQNSSFFNDEAMFEFNHQTMCHNRKQKLIKSFILIPIIKKKLTTIQCDEATSIHTKFSR